ncbi:hypothetical protein EBM89_08565 [Cellulomonas triticagri]|uniref:Septum formation-related domain-containing protein n=2 Tax=Cellulomonas triticagri TaxID=2483352 RepID=A0A3M2JKT9_9CELL|nr:hypothetical protein EBM89_08565 [Cellulomonas triticagri]
MTAKNLMTRCAAVVLAGATALSLAACGTTKPAQRDEATGEITASAEATVFDIAVGDCLDMSGENTTSTVETEVETLPTVPCDQPHDGEVYAEKELEGEKIPADLMTQVEQFCYDEFEPFVGQAYETSRVEIYYLYPQEQSWSMGDRGIQCIGIAMDEPVTGSMRGTGL